MGPIIFIRQHEEFGAENVENPVRNLQDDFRTLSARGFPRALYSSQKGTRLQVPTAIKTYCVCDSWATKQVLATDCIP